MNLAGWAGAFSGHLKGIALVRQNVIKSVFCSE
jgi:hypothetical protein